MIPFAGGGTLPLEAQRLGLEAHASDLNPVAVLINKAMIEIPPKFAGTGAGEPGGAGGVADCWPEKWRAEHRGWRRTCAAMGGGCEDEAEKRIGHLYPKILRSRHEMVRERPDPEAVTRGRKLTVIAWLWARTVKKS